MKGYCRLARKVPTDWASRRGTVRNTPLSSSGGVIIQWDGCKAGESWPKATVEHDQSVDFK
jgi:hypothetical protein